MSVQTQPVLEALKDDSSRRTSRAYGRPTANHDPMITEVSPGTPLGEFMRRYWHPIALSSEVATRPKKVRVLGEDLILFRNRKGVPGLLYPRCMHRGTTLYYGHVEERGIRCCYHGWLFDVEGHCLEQPCEPGLGTRREEARQPWYPVQERYGLVFAYLGPADHQPLLPRYSNLEDIEPGMTVWPKAGAFGYFDENVDAETTPCNWMQSYENTLDIFHAWILHATFTDTAQFAEVVTNMPVAHFSNYGAGAICTSSIQQEGGGKLCGIAQTILPNIVSINNNFDEGMSRVVLWMVPVDDTNWKGFMAIASSTPPPPISLPMTPDGRFWSQMTDEEHQDYPGDFEAQVGQGAITLHSEEHLVQSDIGIGILRRLLRQQVTAVQEGKDAIGVAFDGSDVVEVVAKIWKEPA